MASLDKLVVALLIVVHAGLLAWSVAGFAEFVLPSVPWPSLENPLFPPAILLVQWIAILVGAVTFLYGYAVRLRTLPEAMIAAYTFMGAVCAVETFGYLTHASRFLDMALEYAIYAAIVVYLYRSPSIARRIGSRERTELA